MTIYTSMPLELVFDIDQGTARTVCRYYDWRRTHAG